MPLYLCRWPNSDVSVVQARNKTEAIIRLDEFENAEGAQIIRLSDFLVDFHLNDEGRLEFGTFGEAAEDEIMETAYPELEELKTKPSRDQRNAQRMQEEECVHRHPTRLDDARTKDAPGHERPDRDAAHRAA